MKPPCDHRDFEVTSEEWIEWTSLGWTMQHCRCKRCGVMFGRDREGSRVKFFTKTQEELADPKDPRP